MTDTEIRQEALRAALQLKPPQYGITSGGGNLNYPGISVLSILSDAKAIEAYLRGPEPAPKVNGKRKKP